MLNDLLSFRIFNRLKSVERSAIVGSRHESPAEHTWGCLVLADFFISRMKNHGLDVLRVYELLMYHDVVEIESGDTPLHPDNLGAHAGKKDKEGKAALILKRDLPVPLGDKFFSLFQEFEDQKSVESRFAKSVEQLESEIHELDYKYRWKGWTAEFLIEKKGKIVEEFPELKKAFYELMEYEKREGYFGQ